MIYVPDIDSFTCFTMEDGYIRGYSDAINLSDPIPYTDFLYNSNYYTRTGQETLSEYPACIDSSKLTTNYLYRVDVDKILIMFVIMAYLIIYLPLHLIFGVLLNRRRRV